jgi:hypothetical protein
MAHKKKAHIKDKKGGLGIASNDKQNMEMKAKMGPHKAKVKKGKK